MVYSSRPSEQSVISRLGISGEVKKTPGDYLLVLGQNMGENKMDYYLKRRVTYTGEIRPNGTLEARLDLEVRSLATPGSDLAGYVGGSRSRVDLPEGVARTYLSVMVPAQAKLKQVLFNGAPTTDFRNRLELGRRLFATTIDVAPAETHTVTYIYEVPEVLTADGYRLPEPGDALARRVLGGRLGSRLGGDRAARGVRAGGIARLVGAAYLGEGVAGRGGGAVVRAVARQDLVAPAAPCGNARQLTLPR